MKRIIIYIVTFLATITTNAQSSTQSKQMQQSFKGKIFNSEYDIYINMDLVNSNIIVPQQEIFGEIPGFLGDNKDSRKWPAAERLVNRTMSARMLRRACSPPHAGGSYSVPPRKRSPPAAAHPAAPRCPRRRKGQSAAAGAGHRP